jgi:hypothetical protein
MAVAVAALVTAAAAAVSIRGDGGGEAPAPYDVADVRRAFAAVGEDARVPSGGVALGWSCASPDGYRTFLDGSGSWYAVVFDGESSAAAWEECLAENTTPEWSHARRANVVVVAGAEEAERVHAALKRLP